MTEPTKAPVQPPAAAPQAASPAPASVPAGAGNPLEDPTTRELVRRMVESETRKHLKPVIDVQEHLKSQVGAFDSVMGTLRASGLIKDDTNVDQLRAAYLASEQAKAYTAAPAQHQEPEPAPQAQPPAQQPPPDPVLFEVQRLTAQYGMPMGVKPGEAPPPEWGLLVTDKGLKAYLDSVELAGKTYQARVGNQPEPSGSVTPTPLDMGGGSGAARNPIENIRDPDALLGEWAKKWPK